MENARIDVDAVRATPSDRWTGVTISMKNMVSILLGIGDGWPDGNSDRSPVPVPRLPVDPSDGQDGTNVRQGDVVGFRSIGSSTVIGPIHSDRMVSRL